MLIEILASRFDRQIEAIKTAYKNGKQVAIDLLTD